jgi:phenylacetate-coenzyme A ligase PaaK-like adenylate-forming protein
MRFYITAECPECDEEIAYGPVLTTLEHNGLPAVPYDLAACTSFSCSNPDCGAESYTGDFDLLTD